MPLAATDEISLCRAEIDAAANDVMSKTGVNVSYLVGTMVELPRSAIYCRRIS